MSDGQVSRQHISAGMISGGRGNGAVPYQSLTVYAGIRMQVLQRASLERLFDLCSWDQSLLSTSMARQLALTPNRYPP